MRSRFFSVSPMYLLTTPDKSILNRSQSERTRHYLRGHRLAGSRGAGEQDAEACAATEFAPEPPGFVHQVVMAHLAANLLQLLDFRRWQHEIGPADTGFDLDSQAVQILVGLITACGGEILGGQRRPNRSACAALFRPGDRLSDAGLPECEAGGQIFRPNRGLVAMTVQMPSPHGRSLGHVGHRYDHGFEPRVGEQAIRNLVEAICTEPFHVLLNHRSAGPILLGINLEEACRKYEEKHGGTKAVGGPGTAWHQFDLRAYRVRQDGRIVGMTAEEAERLVPEQRVFIQRVRRGADVMDATSDTTIQAGDVVAVAGRRDVLTSLIGTAAEEVDDRELLAVPIEGVDVFVTNKKVDGQRLADLAGQAWARGVYLRKITRGATATEIPILPDTEINRGDILTLVGRTQDVSMATKVLGHPDKQTDVADVMFIGAAITIGALVGALVANVGGVPLTLSTSEAP